MNLNELHQKAEIILHQLCGDPRLDRWVDASLGIPGVHRGRGPIRLVVLGQDPTVKNERSRREIRCVLNLNRNGNPVIWTRINLVERWLGSLVKSRIQWMFY